MKCSYLLLLILLAGCVKIPDDGVKEGLLQATHVDQKELQKQLSSSFYSEGNYPKENWWEMFCDLELNDFIQRALIDNYTVQNASSKIDAAIAEAQITKSPLLPHINGHVEDKYSHLSKDSLLRFPPSDLPAVVNQIFMNFTFQWELDIFGRYRYQYESALDEINSQKAEFALAKLMVSTAVASTYFEYCAVKEKLRIYEKLVRVHESYVELEQMRFKNGVDPLQPTDSSSIKLQETAQAYLMLRSLESVLKNRLLVLLGAKQDEGIVVKTEKLPVVNHFKVPSDLSMTLLRRRPDIIAMAYLSEAYAKKIGAAKAEFYPNINLALRSGIETLDTSKIFTSDSFAGYLLPSIKIPLFEGGKLRGQLKKAKAEFESVIASYNETILNAASEVYNQFIALNESHESNELQEDKLKSQTQILELSLLRYENGVDNYLEVLNSEKDYLMQELNSIETKKAQLINTVGLIKALGEDMESKQIEDQSTASHETKSDPSKRKKLLTIVTLSILSVFVIVFFLWFGILRFEAYTDDAYVEGNKLQINPQVSGIVVSVNVDNAQYVEKDDLLIQLDDTDFVIAYEKAKAELGKVVRDVSKMYQTVKMLESALNVSKAELAKAEEDYSNRVNLVGVGGVSKERFEHVRANFDAAKASYDKAWYSLQEAEALVVNTTIETHPDVLDAIQVVKQAYVDLKRTKIVSPTDGYIAQRSVQIGELVDPASPLLSLVPLDELWVTANYKETQLSKVRHGQKVKVTSDIYGAEVNYEGTVVGMNPGTGSVFSILPPQNATGNWIKIVQRIPVRVAIDKAMLKSHPLVLGMSMHTTIDLHQQKGQGLAPMEPIKPLYETNVYEKQIEGVDQVIKQIIKDNV